MKKLLMICFLLSAFQYATKAQDNNYSNQMQPVVERFNKATNVAEYQAAARDFEKLAGAYPQEWLPWYYAATCNARIGFLYQDDGEKIEPFSKEGEQQVKRARALLDSSKQKQELSELYCVLSMVYRTKVFINPMTYGREFGPRSQRYTELAKKLDPNNPRVMYLEGWVKYYTPKMWGGDKDAAKLLFNAALPAFGNKPDNTLYPTWGKRECEEMLTKFRK